MKVTQVYNVFSSRKRRRLISHDLKLYTYPIKSFGAVPLTTAQVTPHGFPYDRRFMIFKVLPDGQVPHLQRMTITYFNQMALFQQRIEPCEEDSDTRMMLTIMYRPPKQEERKDITFPLVPSTARLELVDVELHQSPTKAYNMGEPCNSWFSSCFGWEVMLVYLGPHLRPVLGNLSPKAINKQKPNSRSWFSSVTQAIPSVLSQTEDKEGLTFTDVAPYLIVTEESLHDVSARLPKGMKMDMTKFRPNIVLSGAASAYEEDFWGGLKASTINAIGGEPRSIEFILTQNCARCVSLNIDYSTGKPGTGADGSILKILSKDRRVDAGTKYSPIFGRYAFLKGDGPPKPTISIGDVVDVSKINADRTRFGMYLPLLVMEMTYILSEWPGLGG